MGAGEGEGVYYVYAEHVKAEVSLGRHAAQMVAMGAKGRVWWYDPAAPQQAEELRRAGLVVQAAMNDVQAGIDTVYSLFASGRLKIFRSCKWLLNEIENYTWEEAKGGKGFEDAPVKENDDAVDALRYVLHSVERAPRLTIAT